jgi:hypothetical protein
VSEFLSFQAQIGRQGILRCVDVPARISETLGSATHIAVRGRIHGVSFQSTLVPRGDGLHRLFVHSQIWKKLGIDSGDIIEVMVQHDPDPETAIPDYFADALAENPESAENFHALTPARRREVVRFLEAAKRPETRQARVDEIIARLLTDLRPRRPPLLD